MTTLNAMVPTLFSAQFAQKMPSVPVGPAPQPVAEQLVFSGASEQPNAEAEKKRKPSSWLKGLGLLAGALGLITPVASVGAQFDSIIVDGRYSNYGDAYADVEERSEVFLKHGLSDDRLPSSLAYVATRTADTVANFTRVYYWDIKPPIEGDSEFTVRSWASERIEAQLNQIRQTDPQRYQQYVERAASIDNPGEAKDFYQEVVKEVLKDVPMSAKARNELAWNEEKFFSDSMVDNLPPGEYSWGALALGAALLAGARVLRRRESAQGQEQTPTDLLVNGPNPAALPEQEEHPKSDLL